MKSPIKWAGGKSWLELPPSTGTWIEPFAGSAAQFFKRRPAHAILNDANKHLVNFYQQVKKEVAYLQSITPHRVVNAEQYAQFRSMHNKGTGDNTLLAAVLFLTLNRTCFNGLWRENKRGEFNVPWCKDPDRVVRIDLSEASAALQSAELMCGDFTYACERAQPGDTVYMDPPYFGTWDDYQKEGFDVAQHVRVYTTAHELRGRGVNVILSYDNVPHIAALYRDDGWRVTEVSAPRGVRGGRSRAPELLITM